MSSIEKMEMQGVRSFGPDDADRGSIEFFKPLTLILGANGTGKTTIIECLKYMTTGSLPPSSATMKGSLVHNPKVAGANNVRGQVKLFFNDAAGQQYLASRSMELESEPSHDVFKNLDLFLRQRPPGEVEENITTNFTEMNETIPSLLAVPKAVLENVIFCHQEKSNWPMGEGKALKQTFDQIFSTSRYDKVMDHLKEIKEKKRAKIGVMENNLEHLQKNKDEATELEEKLRGEEASLNRTKDGIKKMDDEIQLTQSKLEKLQDKCESAQDLKRQIESSRTEREILYQAEEELRQKVETPFEGATEDLLQMINDMKAEKDDKKTGLPKNREKYEETEHKLKNCHEEIAITMQRLGMLQTAQEELHKNIRKRQDLVKEAASKYLPDFDNDSNQNDITEMRRDVGKHWKDIFEECSKLKENHQREEERIQEEINLRNSNYVEKTTKLQMRKSELTEKQANIHEMIKNMDKEEFLAQALNLVKMTLQQTEKQVQEHTKSLDTDEMAKEIRKLEVARKNYGNQLEKLDEELEKLRKDANIQTELNLLEIQTCAKEKEVEEIFNKYDRDPSFLSLADMSPGAVQDSLQKIESRIEMLNENQLEKTRMLHNLESQLADILQQHKKAETELYDCEQKFLKYCNRIDDFDKELTRTAEYILEKTEELSDIKGTNVVLKRYIKKLQMTNAPCPLCKRGFDDSADSKSLLTTLQNMVVDLPSQIQILDSEISREREKYDQMQQLKPDLEKVKRLRTEELPNLDAKKELRKTETSAVSAEIGKLTDSLKETRSEEIEMQKHLPNLLKIDYIKKEIQKLKDKLDELKSSRTGSDLTRDYQDIDTERKQVKTMLDKSTEDINNRHLSINSHNAKLNDLLARIKFLEDRYRERQVLQSEQENVKSLSSEIQGEENTIVPLKEELSKLSTEQKSIINGRDMLLRNENEKKMEFKKYENDVESLDEAIEIYIRQEQDKHLEENEMKICNLKNWQGDLEEMKKSLKNIVERTSEDVETLEQKIRDMENNLNLRRQAEKCKMLDESIAKRTGELGQFQLLNVIQERKELEDNREKLNKEKNTTEGRLTGYEEAIKYLRETLNGDRLKDAAKKFKEANLDIKTTKIACADLDKYYTTLDRTITTVHRKKLEEINKIIRDLWRDSYRGNDIETIEIIFDVEEDDEEIKKRRIYNYRVVMMQNNVELDMRGAGSAGQKVLASLVIRLALAEIFCVNCGILALDDPTTNLDKENMESLAANLAEIIKRRADQQNFQLIIITHDENFVELFRSSFDYFYRVKKNRDGHSELHKTHIRDLYAERM